MKYIAAIFDMDGLLIDSERPALEAFKVTCEQFGVTDAVRLYGRLLGTNESTTRTTLQKELGAEVDQHSFRTTWEQLYHELTEPGVPLMSGVESLLDYLENNGIPMAVATSTHTDQAIDKLQKAGILERFASITGGDQITHGKPAPDIYLRAASKLSAGPERCIALEDSPNGVRAAVAAGMHTIQIPQLVAPDEELRRLGHQVFDTLTVIPDYLDML